MGNRTKIAGVRRLPEPVSAVTRTRRPVYTTEERLRRDETVWTTVQAILAPVQFAVFLVSLVLVIAALTTGSWAEAAAVSIVAKTAILYAIMVTGAIWERAVFGQFLFAPSFFWEDVVSFGVIALHTAYLVMLALGLGTAQTQLWVALAAYAAYAVNAAQFLGKMALARREAGAAAPPSGQAAAAGAAA